MVSIVNVGLLTYKEEQFGINQSFEEFLKVNYDNSMK
jgi:hypothetical protein